MIYLVLLLILSACGETPTGPSGPYERIETFAGTGDAGKGPEEAPLLQALFYLPQDLTYGPDGRLYILDWNNHRVRVATVASVTTQTRQRHPRYRSRVVAKDSVSTLIGTGELGDAPAGRAREIGLNPSDPHLLRSARTSDTHGLAQLDDPALRLCHRLYRADLRHGASAPTAATAGPLP